MYVCAQVLKTKGHVPMLSKKKTELLCLVLNNLKVKRVKKMTKHCLRTIKNKDKTLFCSNNLRKSLR